MVRETLTSVIERALEEARQAGELPVAQLPPVELDVPPSNQFGDFSSNVALVLARQVGAPPRDVAQRIASHLVTNGGLLQRVDVAGPGFLNFYLKPTWLHDVVPEICLQGDDYGRCNIGQGQLLQVEFVSANPTGPLSVPHGRGAAIGDVLARILSWVGYETRREFYINDAGGQVARFGESVEACYLQLLGDTETKVPDDGYQGDYVRDLARQILAREGDRLRDLPADERLETFTRLARDAMLAQQRETLARFGVHFDIWFSESELHYTGQIDEVIRVLLENGNAYESEGAIWLRSTAFGDDGDRPLVRGNGQPTYIAADLAYHLNKHRRGFQRVIDIWGPDHHGYIARTKAGIQALGIPADWLEILIFQHVSLRKDGEVVAGSKRLGNIVLLDEVIDEVGKDAARFFFLMRGANSPLEFDLDLAKQEALENPVYYVQYAHARMGSILREAAERCVVLPDPAQTDLSPLQHESELALLRHLAELPEEIRQAAILREPHRLTRYGQELAACFHAFYRDCRVLGEVPEIVAARLCLVLACRVALRNVLTILGVSAPERM
ncbi:MAG: arginine--tRNA ligase [Armatimonadetes bacterium]|nr:arginine--tRNA ligase [Armatimonadota bacterium]